MTRTPSGAMTSRSPMPTDALIDDLHASAGYRAQLVRIMLGRAIHTMADSARD